jgi:hypothetical protein
LVVGRFIITDARYAAAQTAGYFLKTPRYPSFAVQWIILLFVGAIILAHLYARVRQTLGPGPGAALRVGFWVGLIAGLPDNLAQATWFAGNRGLPFGWMLDRWIGCILATLVAGFIYKESCRLKMKCCAGTRPRPLGRIRMRLHIPPATASLALRPLRHFSANSAFRNFWPRRPFRVLPQDAQ